VTLERDFAIVEQHVGKQKKLYRIDRKIRALETITFGTTELFAIYTAQAGLSSLSGTPLSRRPSKPSSALHGVTLGLSRTCTSHDGI
jgi:hypothetical protein